jgi:mannitol-specific phosphotransferase system IIBC component
MNDEKDTLGNLFNELENQWDTEHPALGHQERFLNRLEGKKKQRFPFKIAMPVAAAVAILLGLFILFNPMQDNNDVALNKMSPQAKETQMYFSSIIAKELAKVEKENSPETQRIVHDALTRMQQLESDYDMLTNELQEKGENKKILHAMITNLQVRMTFLEKVLTQIENIKKIKENHHESTTI